MLIKTLILFSLCSISCNAMEGLAESASLSTPQSGINFEASEGYYQLSSIHDLKGKVASFKVGPQGYDAAFIQSVLLLSIDPKARCFSPKTVIRDIHSHNRGANTRFLFDVKLLLDNGNPDIHENLIIKGIRTAESGKRTLESDNSLYLKNKEDIQRFHHQSKADAALPLLALDSLDLFYFERRGCDPGSTFQTVTIMKKVPGEPLTAFNGMDSMALEDVYQRVGRCLGELHYRLAKPEVRQQTDRGVFEDYTTTIHGDFHLNNIHFDRESQRVSFVDLETMRKSHQENVHFMKDITYFYNYLKKNNSTTLLPAFINGYCQAHPEPLREDFKIYIEEQIQKDHDRLEEELQVLLAGLNIKG